MEKDIVDKEIKEKIVHYERKPSPEAWNKIANRLPPKPHSIVPVWTKYLAASSIILLLGIAMWSKLMQEESTVHLRRGAVASVRKPMTISAKKDGVIPPSETGVMATVTNNVKTVEVFKRLPLNEVEVEKSETDPIQVTENTTLVDNTEILTTKKSLPTLLSESKDDEVIVLNVVEEDKEEIAKEPLVELTPTETGLKRFWGHLMKFKKGEDIEWKASSKKLAKLFAKADAKITNTRERFIRQEE